MNDGAIVTVDDIPRNAGLFASVLGMYGPDDVEVVTPDGRTGLPLLCRFVSSLRGWGR